MFEINLIGQTLGAYTVVSKIGQGGMAVVYKAYDTALDRYVAIKVLPPSLAIETGFAARFEREAKSIAKLDHPNILPVYSYGQQSGLSYLVMRFVQAGTLKEKMGEPIGLLYIAEIIRQIGDALQYAHTNGIIHRDIKPSNILMANEHWPLLTDFGLAKMMESASRLTGTGVGVGTPAYMSPEQAQGLEVDGRTDIYSLGIMLYEMVIGKVPYEAETPMAVVLKHINAPLPLPSQFQPDLPEAVENVILKALAKQPEDRFQTVTDFTKALDAAIPRPEKMVNIGTAEVMVEVSPIQSLPTPPEPVAADLIPPVNEPTVVAIDSEPANDSAAQPVEETIPAIPPPEITRTEIAPAKDTGKKPAKIQLRPWQVGAGLIAVLLVAALLIWGLGNAPAAGVPVSPTAEIVILPTDASLPLPPTAIAVKPTLILRFTTSSNWATVTFTNGTILSSKQTAVSASASNARIERQVVSLNQDFSMAVVGHQVSSTYEIVIRNDETLKNVGFSMDQGCYGRSGVEILNALVEPPVTVFRKSIGQCGSISFLVSTTLLKTTNPTASAQLGPPQPTLPPGADTDESKIISRCNWFSQTPDRPLCMIKAHSGQIVDLAKTTNSNEGSRPAWSPDGKQIYYITSPSATSQGSLFVLNADGMGETKLVSASDAAWSPDGQTIAYTDDCTVLRLIRPDGTERRFLDTPEFPCINFLNWSPDGRQIAFADLRDSGRKASSIWVVNLDNTNPQRIYQFPAPIWGFYGLAWSPDGKSVGIWYAVKENSDEQGLLLDPAGKAVPQPIDWGKPAWWSPAFWPQWGQ